MSVLETVQTRALAREVHEDLADWAELYPAFNRARFPAVALTTAVHLPDLTRAERLLAALVTMWLFAFDDLVDEGRAHGPALARLVAEYKAVVRGMPSDPRQPSDPLGQVLAEIGQRLAAYDSFGPLATHLQASFEQTVDAIVHDRVLSAALHLGDGVQARGAGLTAMPSPTYAAWMDTAQYSVGVHPYLVTCFILYNDRQVVPRLSVLARITDECARAFRLANDLRTWEKERREQNFNTLAAVCAELQRAQPGLSAAEYHVRGLGFLRERLQFHVAQTRTLLAGSPVPNHPVEVGIGRLVEFVIAFYAAHDYHTFQRH